MTERLEKQFEEIAACLGELVRTSRRLLERYEQEQEKKNAPRPRQEVLPLTREGLPAIAVIWNKWAAEGLPRVVEMTPSSTRYKNAVARWKEHPNEDYWVRVINRMNRSPFCLGQNDRKWAADIEFLCRPDIAARVLEGRYDDKSKVVRIGGHQLAGYVVVDGKQVEVLK